MDFNKNEEKLKNYLNKIYKITSSIKNLSKEKTENALNEAFNNIKLAENIIKEMEENYEKLNQNQKNQFNININNYKFQIEMNKKSFNKIQENYLKNKTKEAISELNSQNQKENLIDENEENNNNNNNNNIENIENKNDNIRTIYNNKNEFETNDEFFETYQSYNRNYFYLITSFIMHPCHYINKNKKLFKYLLIILIILIIILFFIL